MEAKPAFLLLLMVFNHHFQDVDAFCCEKVESYEYTRSNDYKYVCFVSFATINPCLCVIPSTRYDVYKFNVAFQEKVTALPIDFDNRFPNLNVFNASYCSIQAISNENFEDMRKLQYLFLDNNQIETIARDTFSGLSALLMIHLRNNRISSIDIEVFHPLVNLAQVMLKGNECINRNFCGKRQIKIMAGDIGRHCSEIFKAENTTNIGIL